MKACYLLFISVFLLSCKKDYICHCKYTEATQSFDQGGIPTTNQITTHTTSEKTIHKTELKAMEECAKNNGVDTDQTTNQDGSYSTHSYETDCQIK